MSRLSFAKQMVGIITKYGFSRKIEHSKWQARHLKPHRLMMHLYQGKISWNIHTAIIALLSWRLECSWLQQLNIVGGFMN